jgi:hypothetical protein
MYKPSKTQVFANALSRLSSSTKTTSVPNQTTYASLFYIEPKWLNDVKEFLKINKLKAHYQYNKSRDWSRKHNLLH